MDPTPQGASQSTGELAGILKSQYPGIAQLLEQQQPGIAQAQYASDAQVSPQYANLASQLFGTYAPQNAQTGVNVAGINAQGQTQNALNVANGTGGQLVNQAVNLQHQVDPNYYSTADAVGRANAALLNGQDPNVLSGSEQAQVQRSIGQNPANLVPSASSTVNNAMTFGNALAAKQQRFGNTVQQVAGTLPSLKSGISGIGTALSQTQNANTGYGVNTAPMTGTGQNAFNLWNSNGQIFGQAAANSQKQQQPWYTQLGGLAGGIGAAAGGFGGGLTGIGNAISKL